MRHYTVSQLAELSGISVRTLHHYDEIGLLAPAFVGENGYRYYGEEELLRLQQILLHREFGFPLREIGAILDDPAFDRIAALEAHRVRLELEAERYRRLVRTIDRTIAELKGPVTRGVTMKHADLYEGFAPGKQAEYERWLIERYGPQMERSSSSPRSKRISRSAAASGWRLIRRLWRRCSSVTANGSLTCGAGRARRRPTRAWQISISLTRTSVRGTSSSNPACATISPRR